MNPATQYRFDAVPSLATSPGAALNPAQQDTGLAGNGNTVDRSAAENHSHAADMDPARTEPMPMPFPGPYAYAPAPVVAEQPAQAGGATTHATAAATAGLSIGTTAHAPAGAPASSALPDVAGSQHFGQSAPAEGKQDNTDGLPPLIHAATLGDLDRLRTLLAQPGADVNQVDARSGNTALIFAAIAGLTDTVELLLASGAEVNYRNPDTGWSALTHACECGNLDVVNALLGRRGILPDQAEKNGNTALAHASLNGHATIVKRLIGAGADVNYKNSNIGWTALMAASEKGNLEVVDALLGHRGILPDQDGNFGRTALYCASFHGHATIVERLLGAGADVNYRNSSAGWTALMAASEKGNLEVVNALLGHRGIQLDQTDSGGWRALYYGSLYGHAAIVERLIGAGADVNYRDSSAGWTALMAASEQGNLEVVDALLGHRGILPDQANNFGKTALHCASQFGHSAIVERLINARANTALLDNLGKGCLHLAIDNGHVSVVERLLTSDVPLPNPLPLLPLDGEHFVCLSDLYWDRLMPAASVNNPLRLSASDLLDDFDRFLSRLIHQSYLMDFSSTLSPWLSSQGIRQAVIAPLMRCLGEGVDDLLEVLMASDAETVNDRQRLVYCASTLGRLAVLAPDEQIAATYRNAGLSDAGVTRLSQLAIAQRDKLVSFAQAATAQIAADMLEQLVPECIAKTSSTLRVNVDALGTSLIDAGFVPPLANLLARSWDAALVALAGKPAATAQMCVISDMVTFIQKRLEEETPSLFARQIVQRLDRPDLIGAWRITLGETSAEGLFALFDDQCRQLREYGAQMG